ncbi:MAG: acyl carrier protein [Bacteroidales bacterium]|jgi:acyl carrier protein|nr:acyl carrier protein [Bacteroidales bacterium]MBR2200952.1 acyl carrier protein [Bacteroidales bacterium]MBR3713023.1 acyl carrier protein [Bacteroidales bacterium]MBR4272564.1 acyl carrier protein [Bacteroidales bacterium]MBR4325586.1 acyl carrier protein [Bacteroidales bacterium]
MKQKILTLLENELPTVDFASEFLFSEMDSLAVTTVLAVLSEEFKITLDSEDATPKNFMNIDSIVKLVETKLNAK